MARTTINTLYHRLQRKLFAWALPALAIAAMTLELGCGRSPTPSASLGPPLSIKGLRLVRTLTNSGNVSPLAFSPNDQILATGGGSAGGTKYPGGVPGFIQLWHVATGRLLLTLTGHTDTIHTVAFSPDGETLASGSQDTTIKLWNVKTGRLLRTLSGHTDEVLSLCFSSDGRMLASSSMDKTIKVWDTQTGKVRLTFKGYARSVYGLAFSPDDKVLASGSWDGMLKVWDLKRGQSRWSNKSSNPISEIAFSPDGTRLMVILSDGALHLRSPKTGLLLKSVWINPNGGAAETVTLSADGRFLSEIFSSNPEWGQSSSELDIVDTQTGKAVSTLASVGDTLHSPVLSSNGKLLAVLSFGAKQKAISLWARK